MLPSLEALAQLVLVPTKPLSTTSIAIHPRELQVRAALVALPHTRPFITNMTYVTRALLAVRVQELLPLVSINMILRAPARATVCLLITGPATILDLTTQQVMAPRTDITPEQTKMTISTSTVSPRSAA